MPSLSIIVICKNEQQHIAACLESVKFADEIIVLDSGSTDETVCIAKKYTDKVFQQPWLGFGEQKNAALDKATGDWVLSIDCDERVTPELAQSIQRAIAASSDAVGFMVRRRSTIFGHTVRFGDWSRDRVVRLFLRSHARFSPDQVHERVLLQGACAALQGWLEHQPFASMHAMVETMNRYSDLSVAGSGGSSRPIGLAFVRACWTFLRGYFFKGGVLDGAAGLLVAFSTAEGTFWRHAKRWEHRRANSKQLS